MYKESKNSMLRKNLKVIETSEQSPPQRSYADSK
jgi:hypothetical protein